MTRRSRNLLALLLLFGCSGVDSAEAAKVLPREWHGAWQERDSQGGKVVCLNIESKRIVEYDGKSLIVRGLIRREGDRLFLRNQGLKEEWTVAQSGSVLHVVSVDGTTKSFQRLREVPPQVRLDPLRLPRPLPLPPERIQEIRTELETRTQKEQEILQIQQDPLRLEKFAPVRHENREFLRQLVSEVGWIDRNRFGARTSFQAATMAKHTGDLRLMMTILPLVERDFQQPGKGQMYAILYDAIQLELGRKQRYGTQIQEDAAGPFVLPLEDPDKVDDYLKRIGLPSLDVYRAKISNAVFAGKVVRVSREEGPQ